MKKSTLFLFLVVTGAITVCTFATSQVSLHRMVLGIRARNDAQVTFTPTTTDTTGPMVLISLGSWSNTKSFIFYNMRTKLKVDTPQILDKNDYRNFTFEWATDGTLFNCYKGNDTIGMPFLSWKNLVYPFRVARLGIRTLGGSTGKWTCDGTNTIETNGSLTFSYKSLDPASNSVDGCSVVTSLSKVKGQLNMGGVQSSSASPLGGFQWVKATGGKIPDGAVEGGQDRGEVLYVGRAQHYQDLIPGKLHPSRHVVYVAWNGKEYAKDHYEVLVAPVNYVTWLPTRRDNDIPVNAIPGGETENDEILYIGRAAHRGTLTIGKIHPSHRSLYLPYHSAEIAYIEYEILVQNLNFRESPEKKESRRSKL